jgi:Zn-dependent metalloprotease
MALPRCAIVPPYLLARIAASDHPSFTHAAHAAQRTLRAPRSYRPRTRLTLSVDGGTLIAEATPAPDRVVSDARHRTTLPGVAVRSEDDAPVADPSVNEAFDGLGSTFDLFAQAYGRNSIDGAGMPLRATVHYGRDYDNAFWNGSRMVFGDGDGQIFAGFTASLSVVAHELTHGVTQFTSGLIYLNESGALNEAFSDIMGTSVEFYYRPIRGRANYVIAEDVVRPGGLRSMADPLAYGDPDHYSLRYTGSEDNGGVHTNSGIANNAFYLAIEGGSNRTSGLRVTGVGPASRAEIENVFYRAFTESLPSDATFAVARQATIQSARDLYGANGAVERAVTEAWTAVGVN